MTYLGSEVEVSCDFSWLNFEERLVIVAFCLEIYLSLEVALAGTVREATSWLYVLPS